MVSDAASVFTTGEADAWLTLYYNVVYYENQGLGVDVENSVAHPEMASLWTVTGRNDFLQENPDAAVAVLKALQRAKEETVSIRTNSFTPLHPHTGRGRVPESLWVR